MKQLRNTNQRQLVLQAVQSRCDHPSAEQIYEQVRQQDGHISRGTVYRNLNLLSELGQIRRLSMPDGPDHFDLRTDNHYHFYCTECGRVVDTHLPYSVELDDEHLRAQGYSVLWHRLILVGVCPECAAS